MTNDDAQILMSNESDDQGYCTRASDGVSGMTVTALAQFSGTEQQTITQLLNRLRDSDPITNTLPKCLNQFAGKDWRLITKDAQKSLFIIDEICHAVLEYYALEAREYKGKQIAIDNYRTIARGGMRVYLWSQTGYSPVSAASQVVISKEELSALTETLTDINQRLGQIEQRLNVLPPAKSTKQPWTLPSDTPTEEVPEDYIQIEDGSWLSPEAYESSKRQGQRSLPWELREIKKRPELE